MGRGLFKLCRDYLPNQVGNVVKDYTGWLYILMCNKFTRNENGI